MTEPFFPRNGVPKKTARLLYRASIASGALMAALALALLGCAAAVPAQFGYLDAMEGKGWSSWPDVTDAMVGTKMGALPKGRAVAVMTYAGDLFSWYAGSLKAAAQAAVMSSLVGVQKSNLHSGDTNIVGLRTKIATLLRSLLVSTASSASVNTQVLDLSGTYGELDGENNYHYATVFATVHASLTDAQKAKLVALRASIMSGTYADGTPYDYSTCATPFLYSSVITDTGALDQYTTAAVQATAQTRTPNDPPPKDGKRPGPGP